MKEQGEETVKQQLDRISAFNGWDMISEVDTLNGKPVYMLTSSAIPKGAKTGFPHLFSVTDNGKVYELTSEQSHALMVRHNATARQ